ncbi:MAG: methyltransferase [Oscillospiraceae bacterium]
MRTPRGVKWRGIIKSRWETAFHKRISTIPSAQTRFFAGANAKRADRLIDLGTGCGIIPFLMLRDGNLKTAVGVDISAEAIGLAAKTAEENGAYRFTAINADLNDLKGRVEFGCHTLITCNPPYKAPGAGLKNPDGVCAAARHEVACTLSDIISVRKAAADLGQALYVPASRKACRNNYGNASE